MSLAIVRSRALLGMVAPAVTVEAHLANGLPAFTVVGLPDTEVKEARERVRAALLTCGFDFPARRITVNLAPADLPKESGRFDLPIALAILAASGQVPGDALDRLEFAGELALDGSIRAIRGALAMTYALACAGATQRAFVLPRANADEAALVPGATVLPADDLLQVAAHLASAAGDPQAERLARHAPAPPAPAATALDLRDVRGQQPAKRALEIAAAGGHSLLMVGPPGTGKTLLAQRLPGILPPLALGESLESAAVLSLAGRFEPGAWGARPFRAPHHTASHVALVGGGNGARPGEISLAHQGVLFLDELPEFDRHVLEVLREPLESGRVSISRAARQVEYPARFQLVAAMNPCPCGYHGHPKQTCRCSPDTVLRYQQRISGPLLDRIDLRVEVAALGERELMELPDGEPSATVAARVAAARARAVERQGCANEAIEVAQVDALCAVGGEARTLLARAAARLGWSARAHHRTLKVARTIADLVGEHGIGAPHLAEAIQLRRALIA